MLTRCIRKAKLARKALLGSCTLLSLLCNELYNQSLKFSSSNETESEMSLNDPAEYSILNGPSGNRAESNFPASSKNNYYCMMIFRLKGTQSTTSLVELEIQ